MRYTSCNSGMHRCPKVREIPFTATTTNNEFYRPYKIQKYQTESAEPERMMPQRHYDPYVLQTTYNTEFTKKKPKAENNYVEEIVYYQSKTKFQGES